MAAIWGRTLSTSGGRGSTHYEQGVRFFDEGSYEQAIAAFRSTLNEPTCGPLTERLARFYLAEAHSALALTRISKDLGAPCDAITLENLREAVALSPNYADLHFHLGSAHLGRGEYDLAITALRRALAINPNYARATHALGVARYAQGDRAEGLQMARAALGLDPVFRRTALREAVDADAAGDHAAALAALRRMSDTEGGDDALYHARLALDLSRRGLHEEAADEYRQALAINPDYADLRNQFGVTLYALRRDEAALEQFRQALEINPRYVDAHLNRALACARLGCQDEAHAALSRVLELDPGNAAALEALGALEETRSGL